MSAASQGISLELALVVTKSFPDFPPCSCTTTGMLSMLGWRISVRGVLPSVLK